MGIVFSDSIASDGGQSRAYASFNVDYEIAEDLVRSFHQHNYPPLADAFGLQSFFSSAVLLNNKQTILTLHNHVNSFYSNPIPVYNLLEIVSVIIMLAKTSWSKRLHLLFLFFKSRYTSLISYHDTILICQVMGRSLARLWGVSNIDLDELFQLSEVIADGMYSALDKEIEDGVDEQGFLRFMSDRFKETKVLSSFGDLLSLYKSPFDQDADPKSNDEIDDVDQHLPVQFSD